MELLKTTKSKYILDAGLEVLHEQSNEWLNEIAFWQDEVSFFYALVVKKTLKSVPISAKDNIINIEKELTAMTTGGELAGLQQSVMDHEQYLGHMLESHSGDENIYREKHRELSLKFYEFEERLRTLKKEVFNLVKLINKNKTD